MIPMMENKSKIGHQQTTKVKGRQWKNKSKMGRQWKTIKIKIKWDVNEKKMGRILKLKVE